MSVSQSWQFNLVLLLLLSQWSCCGAHGPDDWNLNIYFNCTELNPSRERCGVPFSCCVKDPAVSHSAVRKIRILLNNLGDNCNSTSHFCVLLFTGGCNQHAVWLWCSASIGKYQQVSLYLLLFCFHAIYNIVLQNKFHIYLNIKKTYISYIRL